MGYTLRARLGFWLERTVSDRRFTMTAPLPVFILLCVVFAPFFLLVQVAVWARKTIYRIRARRMIRKLGRMTHR